LLEPLVCSGGSSINSGGGVDYFYDRQMLQLVAAGRS